MQKRGKIVLCAVALVLVVAVLIGAYCLTRPKVKEGSKTVTITVADQEGKETVYTVHTDALYLKDVMDQAKGLTYSGNDQGSGLLVDTVNQIRADYTLDGAYWGFFVNGAYCNYGIEEQPVADGDAFSIVYTDANAQ